MSTREELIGGFIARLLERASIVMGDLDISADDWWIEFRPGAIPTIRLRYLTPDRNNRRITDWRIALNHVFELTIARGREATDIFIDKHLHEFKRLVRA